MKPPPGEVEDDDPVPKGHERMEDSDADDDDVGPLFHPYPPVPPLPEEAEPDDQEEELKEIPAEVIVEGGDDDKELDREIAQLSEKVEMITVYVSRPLRMRTGPVVLTALQELVLQLKRVGLEVQKAFIAIGRVSFAPAS